MMRLDCTLPAPHRNVVYELTFANIVQFVGVCQMRDIFNPPDARNNTEARRMLENRTYGVRLIAAFESKLEADDFAARHIEAMDKPPYCNAQGLPVSGRSRAIMCSNGQRYASQSEAARLLDVQQSAISMQLRGDSRRSVAGLRFWYADQVQENGQ